MAFKVQKKEEFLPDFITDKWPCQILNLNPYGVAPVVCFVYLKDFDVFTKNLVHQLKFSLMAN